MSWWRRINWAVLVASLVLLVGYFVPWIQIGEGEETRIVAGYAIAGLGAEFGAGYYASFLVPVLAILMGIAAVKKPALASILAILTGASMLAWGIFEIARFLFLQTYYGLWLTVAGAMVAAFGGALTWRRARVLVVQAKAAAKAAKDAGVEEVRASEAAAKAAEDAEKAKKAAKKKPAEPAEVEVEATAPKAEREA